MVPLGVFYEPVETRMCASLAFGGRPTWLGVMYNVVE